MKLQWRRQNRTRNKLRMNRDTRMRWKSMTSHRQPDGKLLLRYVQSAFTNHRGIFLKTTNIQCLGDASVDLNNDWRRLRPVPNAAPLMCRTKLNTVRLWSDFGATADSDGVLASDLIREGHGKYFSMRKICDLN